MHVIRSDNVNDAWPQLIDLVMREGVVQETRAGQARVIPVPVSVVYERPERHVLFDPVRDANPIFHFFESLWMLAGRDDADWLDRFVSDFSKRFAEDGGRMHGAYGKRWRGWFSRYDHAHQAVNAGTPLDQLDEAVRVLREDPQSRQVVIGMWDPTADLGVPGLKDRPCNTQVMLRCDRLQFGEPEPGGGDPLVRRYLDMMVTNRSNDVVYGMAGANAVHFAQLQCYLAARIGVQVGTYTQVSNNAHMYEWSEKQVDRESAMSSYYTMGSALTYPGYRPLVDHPESFDEELSIFLEDPHLCQQREFRNRHFPETAYFMWMANEARREKNWGLAIRAAESVAAPDWREATMAWLSRREAGRDAGRETRE